MRIAVGFKVTPDFELLRAADWARLAGAEGQHGRAEAARFVRRVFGAFDEAALELALRLRDERTDRGLPTELAAFTVGGREADPFLATLQALGFTCTRVDAGAEGKLDLAPAATAALVAACTQRLGGDVLLLGERGSPGGSGTVPFLTAEMLGRLCVSGVTGVGPAADDRLRVTFTTDNGPMRGVAGPPCVLAVGNAVVSMLRVPTLRERLAVRDVPVAEYSAEDLGVDVEALAGSGSASPVSLTTIDRARAGVVVPGETPAEQARALYEDHLRARLELL